MGALQASGVCRVEQGSRRASLDRPTVAFVYRGPAPGRTASNTGQLSMGEPPMPRRKLGTPVGQVWCAGSAQSVIRHAWRIRHVARLVAQHYRPGRPPL